VSRHEDGALVGIQEHGKEITRVHTEYGPSVGGDLAYPLESGLEGGRGGEVRKNHNMVDLARPAVPTIDRTYLACEDEAHRPVPRRCRQALSQGFARIELVL